MDGGGRLLMLAKEAQKILQEVYRLCLILAWSSSYSSFASFYILVSKSNLYDMFHFSGFGSTEKGSSLRKDAQQLETEGLRKIEVAVAGLEAEGLYEILRGAISHSPVSSIPPTQNLATPHLPPSPNHPPGAWRSCTWSSHSCGRRCKTGTGSHPSSSSDGYPHLHDTPLPAVGGHQEGL